MLGSIRRSKQSSQRTAKRKLRAVQVSRTRSKTIRGTLLEQNFRLVRGSEMSVIHIKTKSHKNYSYTLSDRRVATEVAWHKTLPGTVSVTVERIWE